MPTTDLNQLLTGDYLEEIEASLKDEEPMEPLVHGLLQHLGEDPDRDGLKNTPLRVAKALRELTRGYSQDPEAVVRSALFDVTYDEMVIVKDIEVFSLCEHHMLPFFGKLHVPTFPGRRSSA